VAQSFRAKRTKTSILQNVCFCFCDLAEAFNFNFFNPRNAELSGRF
jgi:hypothetical protein